MTSLPVYIETFRENKYNQVKEYEIAGKDFVIDICGTLDIMRPAIEMLVRLQDLQVPIWKICVWSPKVISELSNVAALSLTKPNKQFGHLDGCMEDIRKEKYKGVKLVPGWLLVGTGKDENQETVYKWMVRDQKDYEKDLKQLALDLTECLESQYERSVTQMQEYLTSLQGCKLLSDIGQCPTKFGKCPSKSNFDRTLVQSQTICDKIRLQIHSICSLQ
jgi:hypothetical protein